jgi:hypothetical protein
MPRITYIARNKKNTGLVFNEKEIMALYFYGIDIVNRQGTKLSREVIEFYVRSAQDEIEKYLAIKLIRQIYSERSDYYRNEFNNRGFIKTKLPVAKPIDVDGYLGEQKQISYPRGWLTANQSGDSPTSRQIVIVPNSNVADLVLGAAVYGGTIIPYLGLLNNDQIGSYFHVRYITGFPYQNMPFELINVVGKLASIGLFNVLGDIVLGQAAIASYSLSIDGLSTSVGTTMSAENSAFSARIKSYQTEIKDTMNKLKGIYKGITLSAI